MKSVNTLFFAIALCLVSYAVSAQEIQYHGGHAGSSDDDHPKLHINPRWSECSFQLDPGLTQDEWREFTKEAGLVVYFHPLIDAKPIGKRNFEVSLLQWSTAIDETKDAWNDTFVHPDSSHWLVGGPRLAIPGLTGRVGITDRLDIGVYITKSPGANYGFYGAQTQYNLFQNAEYKWSTSIRGSFVRIYGPEDVSFTVYGADIVTSKDFVIHEKWLTLAPYVTLSARATGAHEKSDVVNLEDELVGGVHGSLGLVANAAFLRLGVEYNYATVNTVSMKIGASF